MRLSVLLIRKYFKQQKSNKHIEILFECLVNSEVFQTLRLQLYLHSLFECLVNSEVFQTKISFI